MTPIMHQNHNNFAVKFDYLLTVFSQIFENLQKDKITKLYTCTKKLKSPGQFKTISKKFWL